MATHVQARSHPLPGAQLVPPVTRLLRNSQGDAVLAPGSCLLCSPSPFSAPRGVYLQTRRPCQLLPCAPSRFPCSGRGCIHEHRARFQRAFAVAFGRFSSSQLNPVFLWGRAHGRGGSMGPGSCPRHASTTTAGQRRQLFPARPAAAEPHPLQHHGAVPGSSCGWITFGSFSPRSPHQGQLGAESPS